MRKLMFGAAALALAAASAHADPGGGNGNGKGGGGGEKAAQGQSTKPDRGPSMKDNRGPSMREAKADRGPSMKAERQAEARFDRGDKRAEKAREVRAERVERRVDRDRSVERYDEDRFEVRDGRRYVDNVRNVSFGDDRRGLIDGCPPGLAKKNNGCLPPGLAKDRDYDYRNAYYDPAYYGYRSFGDGRYFVDDGYLYRMNTNGSVLGYLPLLGGALSVGNPWPNYYQPASVPNYYVDYYNLGPANSYRYADNVLYRVDPQTSTINSIAALLTGDQWAVGQPMPMGYDVYNVPYGYQDRYVDGPDAYYRYSDGYVYQVDPTTQLVESIIQLLV